MRTWQSESLHARRAFWNVPDCRRCPSRCSSAAGRVRATGLARRAPGGRGIAAGRLRPLERQAAARGQSPFNFFLAALALYFGGSANANAGAGRRTDAEPGRAPLPRTPGMFVGVLALDIDVTPGRARPNWSPAAAPSCVRRCAGRGIR
jgi:hypothetical protein